MSEAMSLEEYKKKVLECLRKNHNFTETEARSSMESYETGLPWYLERKFTPAEMAVTIAHGY